MVVFYLFISFVITQRLLELLIAKRNEMWLRAQGGVEFGRHHYYYMVSMHILFFICLIFEVLTWQKELTPLWPVIGSLFLLTQAGRVWALASLGKYWNTKIIVVPGADVVRKGPYRFIRHPNYMIVTIEFLVIPLMFSAYGTLLAFSLLNVLILMIRIPSEERALATYTDYKDEFDKKKRFFSLPFLKKV